MMTTDEANPEQPTEPAPAPGAELVPVDHPPLFGGPQSNRRGFLGLAAGAGAAAISGAVLWSTRDRSPASQNAAEEAGEAAGATSEEVASPEIDMTPQRSLPAAEDTARRTLVVVELQGGNDGLATLVPRESGILHDRRQSIHIPDEELLDFTDGFGWNPSLAGLSGHGIAALLGVGATTDPNGSHFEMEQRWWTGRSSGRDMPFTGFFGRLCDQLATDQPVTGVSLGSNASPALRSDRAVTVGLSDFRAGWFLHSEEDFYSNMRTAFSTMANGADVSRNLQGQAVIARMAGARRGLSDTLAFGEALAEVDEARIAEVYPRNEIGELFGATIELIRQDTGIRVIHLTHGGFDTHSNQRSTHNRLLTELGDAMGIFLSEIDESGLGDSTLVCTTSEFGRRVGENDNGTDHGQAGMAMLSGPVNPGVHGEAPSLTDLNDGNLIATVDFEEYYATIAEQWFGVPSSEVLGSNVAPIEGLIAT